MTNPQEHIATAAEGELGVREVGGNNQGLAIRKYWEATAYGLDAYKNREPWCAAFVSWCVLQASLFTARLDIHDLPRLSLAYDFDSVWGSKNATVFYPESKDYTAQRGDIVVFNFSHVGIVTAAPSAIGRGRNASRVVSTVEGNTDADGSRNGDGVYRKERPFYQIRSFVRVPARALPA